MTRSEMIEIIINAVKADITLNVEEAEIILKNLEEEGMLPPYSGKIKCWKEDWRGATQPVYYENEWEVEEDNEK